MSIKMIPLYEAVRPRGNRDEAGQKGEYLHQCADFLQKKEDSLCLTIDDESNVLLKLREASHRYAQSEEKGSNVRQIFARALRIYHRATKNH